MSSSEIGLLLFLSISKGRSSIAAGQNTTVFLARPTGEPYSELERHPSELEVPEECLACAVGDDEDESNPLLACDKVCSYWNTQMFFSHNILLSAMNHTI
jgi:hypothetical protein